MSNSCQLEKKIQEKVEEWLAWDRNSITSNEIKKLNQEKNIVELQKKLLSRLEFGTAGLRGKMSSGYACMNDLVIIQTAQGLLNFLEENRTSLLKSEGIVVGYDGRHNSKRWAELTTVVFVTAGYKVKLFSQCNITPFIPFSVKMYGCASGVMVTASHNPKDDNGYKVYDSNGAQIVSPTDKKIQLAILANLKPLESSWLTEVLKNNPLVTDPWEEVSGSYLEAVSNSIHPDCIKNNKKIGLNFVYTALHGVGFKAVDEVAKIVGINIIPVTEQRDPDPEFPTVRFPNPEEGKSSLDLSFHCAEANNSQVVLANDPDADRFAVAEKNKNMGEWKIFTGNELGCLFGWWMLQSFKKLNPDVPLNKVYMISSTVSSMILKTMAKIEGFNFIDTLTGFKWLANKALDLEQEGYHVIFCFEEAIGFMCNSSVPDKDGVSALAHFSCFVSEIYGNGLQIIDKLTELYDIYGFHVSLNSYYFCYDKLKINEIFDRITNYLGKGTYPTGILNDKYKIKSIRDLMTGYDNSQPNNKPILPVSCSSKMITFIFENGLHVTLRTSGTEPKIKYYTELCTDPSIKDRSVVDSTLKEMVDAICDEFLQPELNNLIPQCS